MTLLSFIGSPHGGTHKLLPEWQSQPPIQPRAIIDHSIVGSGLGAWLFFRDMSSLESHFIVLKTGMIWQLMDTDRKAEANLNANGFALSIETEDDGDPNTDPWTPAQLASLIWLHAKLASLYPDIKLQRCDSCTGSGLGYHTLFGAPSCWTPSAKTCPGTIRKRQWHDVLLPAFINTTQEEVDLVTRAEVRAEVEAALREVLSLNPDEVMDVPFGQRTNAKIFTILTTAAQAQSNDEAMIVNAINTIKREVDSSEAAVLGAIAALKLNLTPQQISSIASQVNIDEAKLADAVRLDISQALET